MTFPETRLRRFSPVSLTFFTLDQFCSAIVHFPHLVRVLLSPIDAEVPVLLAQLVERDREYLPVDPLHGDALILHHLQLGGDLPAGGVRENPRIDGQRTC